MNIRFHQIGQTAIIHHLLNLSSGTLLTAAALKLRGGRKLPSQQAQEYQHRSGKDNRKHPALATLIAGSLSSQPIGAEHEFITRNILELIWFTRLPEDIGSPAYLNFISIESQILNQTPELKDC
jgi:hypothetical protein